MKHDQNHYDVHVLICTNEKKNGAGCGPKGGQQLVDQLKAWSKEQKIPKKIRINKSGCLGRCDEAIACVAYPKGDWQVEVDLSDEQKLQDWILKLSKE